MTNATKAVASLEPMACEFCATDVSEEVVLSSCCARAIVDGRCTHPECREHCGVSVQCPQCEGVMYA